MNGEFAGVVESDSIVRPGEPTKHNADISWTEWKPADYFRKNYLRLLPEDRQIIGWVSTFLGEHYRRFPSAENAFDVGAGTNLYPALLMLPWADTIMVTDYAQPNVDWLAERVHDRSQPWQWRRFWDEVADQPGYRDVADPQRALAQRVMVQRQDIFRLPRDTWDLGTMFFVADGITGDLAEFEAAVESFLRALRPGSPFVAAFMAGSEGYAVADLKLPAVRVTKSSLRSLLASMPAEGIGIRQTDPTTDRIRSGYDGVLVATGFATA